jgi:primosomal replication protein N
LSRNQITLDGVVVAIDELRYTPAGIPMIHLTLHHQSMQTEAGTQRSVEFDMEAVAIGAIATGLADSAKGATIAVQGFLAGKSLRNPYPLLHINKFKSI